MISACRDGGPGSPSNRVNDAVREESAFFSSSGGDSAGPLGFGTVAFPEKEARISGADNSVETRVSGNTNESRVLKVENEESGALENQPSSSGSIGLGNGKKNTDVRNGKSEGKGVKSAVPDYDLILSEFDLFASKGGGEAVGFEYEIGDMVWGKVKSHPWWPGHIYNEEFASSSVQRSKREGHVLVAFFGDSSYGWFDPSELVSFEENFADKSRQTSSRAFVKAVEEALDEISRRQGLGLACCCRNEFNFGPSTAEGYFVVDVGDYEPGVYSLRQINMAREDFRTKEMLSFVQQLALSPMTDHYRKIEFIKHKATVLACRKALFEEFDETYAQAFGTVPLRPPRPSAPIAVDPSKAPLSGRLVFAEALGKGKLSVKPTKLKDQMEDTCLFVRRGAPIHMKAKKMSSVQVEPTAHSLPVDRFGLSGIPMDSSIKIHMHQTCVSVINDGQHQSSSDRGSVVSGIKPSEGSKKPVEGVQKNAKACNHDAREMSAKNETLDTKKKKKRKIEASTERVSGELSAENITLVNKKKREKEITNEGSANIVQLPLANSDSGTAVEKVSGILLDVLQLANEKDDDVVPSVAPVEAQQAVDIAFLVRELCTLALDPFHGVMRNSPLSTQMVFLKYRSLVYQKSLVSSPPTGNENIEVHSSAALLGPADKTNDKSTKKHMKSSARRIDDPTKGGKKRCPFDHAETIKKKVLVDPEGILNKRMKIVGSQDIKKKKIIDDLKLVDVGNTAPKRLTESQHGDVKEIGALPKAVKVEPRKRMMEQAVRASNPSMLVMKFPTGAALPSGAQLRAKFARFGPLDLDATRVFWKTYTCRLVYRRKVDAEEALGFAVGSSNLFGSTKVRCYVREVGVEASSVESDAVKIHKESRESAIDLNSSRSAAKTCVQQSVQLKSCLKKPSNVEGGNGNGRDTRVKFILGGESSSSTKTHEQLSSFPVSASHNSAHSMDTITSIKNLPKFVSNSSIVTPLPTTYHQFQKSPMNMPIAELLPRSFNIPTPTSVPSKDISQQLLNLLTRCSDVVNNVTGVLGYMPYHSL